MGMIPHYALNAAEALTCGAEAFSEAREASTRNLHAVLLLSRSSPNY